MKFDFSLESVDVTIDGRALKFYPLNFKALRTMAKDLDALKKSDDPEAQFVGLCKVLAASANRKGITVTEDELAELLSIDWANKIISAVNELSGFKKTEEASDPKVRKSIGDGSTPVSLVLPDTPGTKLTN